VHLVTLLEGMKVSLVVYLRLIERLSSNPRRDYLACHPHLQFPTKTLSFDLLFMYSSYPVVSLPCFLLLFT
jgi:hypothetical protein